MFTDEEQATALTGATVQDAWIALQLLEKAATNGVIQPVEFAVLSTFRNNLTAAISAATGKNYDEEVARQRQMMAEMQRQAAQQATAPAQAEVV